MLAQVVLYVNKLFQLQTPQTQKGNVKPSAKIEYSLSIFSSTVMLQGKKVYTLTGNKLGAPYGYEKDPLHFTFTI